jgi:hypothetical protein
VTVNYVFHNIVIRRVRESSSMTNDVFYTTINLRLYITESCVLAAAWRTKGPQPTAQPWAIASYMDVGTNKLRCDAVIIFIVQHQKSWVWET